MMCDLWPVTCDVQQVSNAPWLRGQGGDSSLCVDGSAHAARGDNNHHHRRRHHHKNNGNNSTTFITLHQCDVLVGTFSSQLSRLALELMVARQVRGSGFEVWGLRFWVLRIGC